MSADTGNNYVDRDSLHRPCAPGAPDHVREPMTQGAARATGRDWDACDASTTTELTDEDRVFAERFGRRADARYNRRLGRPDDAPIDHSGPSVFDDDPAPQPLPEPRRARRLTCSTPRRGRTRQRRRSAARRSGSRRVSASREGPGDPDGESDPPGCLANLPRAEWGSAVAGDAGSLHRRAALPEISGPQASSQFSRRPA